MTTTRRTLIAGSVAAAVTGGAPLMASAAASEPMAAIDVHAHCVPGGLVPALEANGGRYGIEVLRDGNEVRIRFGDSVAGPLDPRLSDLPTRIATMDRTKVARQLLSPFIGLTGYGLDDAAGRWYSRLHNETMVQTAQTTPHRFTPMATVPLQSAAAATELRYAVEHLGMPGVQIATDTGAGNLDDDSMEPFWQAAEELRCLVLIHPAGPSRQTQLPYRLNNFVGNPAETTLAAARLMFGGVLDRHPGLRVCLVHGGGFLPYQIGRLERGFRVYGGDRIKTSPLELLRRLHYDTVLHSGARIRTLIEAVGIDRVVLGTDYPFDMGDPDPQGTLAGIPGLRERERQLIVSRNAQRLVAGGPL